MPENHTLYQERLASLRMQMKDLNLDGFILPRTDEFQGEFLADYAERLSWLTGFTGSAGACVILNDKAVVTSDGRYTIQLAQQVDQNLYSCADSTKISVGQWLVDHTQRGRIGYDQWLHTPAQIEKIQEELTGTEITLVPLSQNPIDHIWHDQASKPTAKVTIFPDKIAGKSAAQKRGAIANELKSIGVKACLITMSDSICWLLNIRGGDIGYSPLALSYAIIYDDGTLDWFIDPSKITNEAKQALGHDISVKEIDEIERALKHIDGAIGIDTASAPIAFENMVVKAGGEYKAVKDPCTAPKAIKTPSEQAAIRKAHITDGLAVTKFLKWIADENGITPMSELSAEAKLEEFRKESSSYLEPSFPTIAGFAGNGAIVHYRATEKTDKVIKGNGLLLIDSGGQYKWGTTDITRTVAIGAPTQEMRENYTRVLKGHIAVANAKFPKGTTGKEIDALARAPLKEAGLDYAHGTGHGVGCYLCVHEAAANFSPRGEQVIEPGMLISNEPGYYKEGEYGIRLENLVLVHQEEGTDMLYFETVTLAPFAGDLIVMEMLNEAELNWLNAYHKDVEKALSISGA